MEGRFNDLLYVVPKTAEMRELSGDKLEEINGESLILSYEILSNVRVDALNAVYDCVLVRTNYTYNYLFNHPIISGGFFAQDAQEQGRATAVLSLSAANSIFGNSNVYGKSITINTIKYTVVGVIDDGNDDENRIYVPVNYNQNQNNTAPGTASPNDGGKRPGSQSTPSVSGPVFLMTSAANTSADYVKNELKAANISDMRYYFAPIGVLAALVGKMPINALKIMAIIFSIIILIAFILIFLNCFRLLRQKLGEAYFSYTLRHNPGLVFKFLGSLAFVLGALALIVFVINSMLLDVLSWMDMRELLGYHFYSDCAGVIEQIRPAAFLTLAGTGVLAVAGVILIIAFILKKNDSEKI